MTLVKLFLFTIEDAIDEESILEQEQSKFLILMTPTWYRRPMSLLITIFNRLENIEALSNPERGYYTIENHSSEVKVKEDIVEGPDLLIGTQMSLAHED